MIKRLVIAVILLAVVGGGLIGFNLFRSRMIEQIFANLPVQPLAVETVEAGAVTWQPALTAIGTVNAIRGVDLTVEAPGILREVQFEANSLVEEGQLLVRLDDVVQRADLEAARAQLGLERTNLSRQRELQNRGVTTNATFDTVQAAFRAAEAQVARAEAVVEQRQVTAPFAGTIGLLRVDVGQYVQPGTIIATLQDLQTMRVDFTLTEQNLPDLSIGQAFSVRSDEDEQVFEGRISGIDPRVDPSSRLVAIRGTVDTADGTLTPGQFVRLNVDLPEETGVVALPQTAVQSSLYGDFVYVVRPAEDGAAAPVARQVFVTPGRRSDERIEIREGIAVGDIVVVSGQNRLTNGASVTLSGEGDAAEGTEP